MVPRVLDENVAGRVWIESICVWRVDWRENVDPPDMHLVTIVEVIVPEWRIVQADIIHRNVPGIHDLDDVPTSLPTILATKVSIPPIGTLAIND